MVALAFCSSLARAEVVKIVVDDTIQPITAEYISRAIDQAARSNAQAVLIEMNTPGGLVSSTREIIEKITSSPVPVIVYVTPTRRTRGVGGDFYSGIRRRCGHGSGNGGGSGTSRGVDRAGANEAGR